jgi:hypothetical protein
LCSNTVSVSKYRRYLPYALLLAEVLVFYRHALFLPGYVFPWDLRYYHYPHAWFIAESFRNFDLPLWDPYTYFGYPFLANLQTQWLYPPLVLLILTGNLVGGDVFYLIECNVILHVFLGGVFTFWLLRRLGAGTPASLVGASIYQLGGFFPSHVQNMGSVAAAAWIPLAWLSVLALRDSLKWLLALAAALAMSTLSGYTPVTAAAFASTLFLSLLLVVFRQSPRRLPLLALAGCAWGVALAAVQLLPTIQFNSLSISQYRTDFLKSGGGAPLQSLVSLVWPDYYNIFDLSRYSWKWEVTHMYLYCGILGLGLAAAALFRRQKETALFAIMTGVSLLATLGDSTPVGSAVHFLLPGFIKNGLHPEFTMPCFTLGIAVLAGLGAQRWLRKRYLAWGAAAVIAADLILVGSGRPMNSMAVQREPGVRHDSFHGNPIAAQRMRLLANRTVPPSRIDTVNSSIDWALSAPLLEIPSANGADPMVPARAIQVRLAFCKGERWGSYYQVTNPESPVLDLVNVRYLISREPVQAAGFSEVTRLGGEHVYENSDALPRFFLVSRIQRASGLEEAARMLRSPDFDPRREAIVEGSVEFQEGNVSGTVKVLRYEPRTVILETDTPAPAYLVTSDSHYPGWRAFMEGKEVALHYTNVAFRGLAVPAGKHVILMRFAPPLLKYSAALSAAACLVWLGALIRSGVTAAASKAPSSAAGSTAG